MRSIAGVAAVLMGFLLVGCASVDEDDISEYKGKSAQSIFLGAEKDLASGHYKDAAKGYEALTAMYPDGPQAQQAQIDLVYAYFKAEDYPSAVASADQFIRLYPGSTRLPYAYYLRGMSQMKTDRGPIQNFVGIDESLRDPGEALAAFNDFQTIVRQFPDSKYAGEARKNMTALRNMFAKHHLHIANFYYRREAYMAAADRAKIVANQFPDAPQTKQALELMVKSYEKMGLTAQAKEAAIALQQFARAKTGV